eukprot:9477205-Pyramimonas_sp.AAC.1
MHDPRCRLQGRTLPTARHVGPQISATQTCAAELTRRIRAMGKRYSECGAFWNNANFPRIWNDQY